MRHACAAAGAIWRSRAGPVLPGPRRTRGQMPIEPFEVPLDHVDPMRFFDVVMPLTRIGDKPDFSVGELQSLVQLHALEKRHLLIQHAMVDVKRRPVPANMCDRRAFRQESGRAPPESGFSPADAFGRCR